MSKVIMVSGLARSGKDYISDRLCSHFRIKKYAFADPIKRIVASTFDIDLNIINELKNDEASLTHSDGMMQLYRNIFQRFGTEAMQSEFGTDVWAKKLIHSAFMDSFYIVSDFRFEHEFRVLKDQYMKFNIFTINVVSDSTKQMDHSSETSLKCFNFDYVFDNSDKENTEEKLKYLIEAINDNLRL